MRFFRARSESSTVENSADSSSTLPAIDDETMSESLLNDLLPIDTKAIAIKAKLDETVVGQDNAKTAMSVLLSAHLGGRRRVSKTESPNALLIGSTGVGKTHTVQTAAEYLGIPFVNVDSTSLVPSATHEGMTIERVLVELLLSAETILVKTNTFAEISAVDLAKRGLIFLDEFDKLRAGNDSEWNLRVQRRLLRLIEGNFTTLRETRGHALNTSDIMFLASGTFDGIRDPAVISRRPPHLTSSLRDPDRVISPDLVAYGFLPELIARLPILVNFDPLSAADLVGILSNPAVDPSQVWHEHFSRVGKRLIIEEDAKWLIANRAENLNMGARGLQQVLFPMLARLAYNFEKVPATDLVLTVDLCDSQMRMGW